MALSNGNEASTSNNIYLKLVAEAWPTTTRPHLEKKAKNEATGKYELTWEKFTKIDWVIKNIKSSHNGKTGMKEVKGFSFWLQDWDETYYIDATMTNASKDLANMVLNNIGKKVSLSFYLNKSGYPSTSWKDETWAYLNGLMAYPLDKNALWNAIDEQTVKKDEIDMDSIPF